MDLFGFEPPAPAAPSTKRRAAEIGPALDDGGLPRLRLPDHLPAEAAALWRRAVFLGTSSWSFPGWTGLVWSGTVPEARLARDGLAVYAHQPLLNGVGIDRAFYAPLETDAYARYREQVPEAFRFVVKAPGLVTDAVLRDATGRASAPNEHHLDATLALERFVHPACEGLGTKAGALVFQFPPLPRGLLADAPGWIARLGAFCERVVAARPAPVPIAVEVRDAALLTPRFVATLRDAGATLCIGLHANLPPLARQLRALDALEQGRPGPFVVRWSLSQLAGLKHEGAKRRYEPFDRIVDADDPTIEGLAERAAQVARAGQPAMIVANNKAEGSAPLTVERLARAIAARL